MSMEAGIPPISFDMLCIIWVVMLMVRSLVRSAAYRLRPCYVGGAGRAREFRKL
jgi:hypothetical protein